MKTKFVESDKSMLERCSLCLYRDTTCNEFPCREEQREDGKNGYYVEIGENK